MNIDPVGRIFSQGLAVIERGAKDNSFALGYHDFVLGLKIYCKFPQKV